MNISDRVVGLFTRSNNKPLSYNELVGELQLSKKEKALLSETLQAMMAEGTVAKKAASFPSSSPNPCPPRPLPNP